ncbi:centromere protein S-like [Anthonomus grandis grandis]|uniref:centromere protein S-like n=1 Tax=Anthonomus grandis grandis TaxID=2921223 RepID=UPI002165D479|nr:centromere protein S-like [Anthonomus grandis grandis]
MDKEQKMKQHIYTYSKNISNEVGEHFNMTFETDALHLIAEMAYKKLNLYGADLEAFGKHAKRSVINVDDVKLLVRRNESLRQMINEKAQFLLDNRPPQETAATAKRKRKATNSTS